MRFALGLPNRSGIDPRASGQSDGAGNLRCFELSQKIDEIFSTQILLKYNSRDVEAQVVAVQYQAVIPYLVETVVRRSVRLNQGLM